MSWALGCLSLIFIFFGGCVLISGASTITAAPAIGAAATLVGGGIVLFSTWLFYKSLTRKRRPKSERRGDG